MDEFNNNNEGQGYNPMFNGNQGYNPNFNDQTAQNFNKQPNNDTQNNEPVTFGSAPQTQYAQSMDGMPQEQKGLSIASMVCGILSLVGCWCCGLGVVLAIVAIVLGIIGRKKGGKGFALAGIICGSIGVITNLIYLAWYVFMIVDQM